VQSSGNFGLMIPLFMIVFMERFAHELLDVFVILQLNGSDLLLSQQVVFIVTR